MTNTYGYVKQLLKLNEGNLKPRYDSKFYAAIALGFTEELLELHEAVTDSSNLSTDVSKECGDVFAYAVLLMVSNELTNDVHLFATDQYQSIITYVADAFDNALAHNTEDDIWRLSLQSASYFKRWFREGAEVSTEAIASLAAAAFHSCYLYIKAGEVMDANISKLKERKQRGTMLQGKGNNR